MISTLKDRARVLARAAHRALASAAAFGVLAGVGLGFSYVGGWIAEQSGLQARAERLSAAADGQFAPDALAEAGIDASARLVAERHDPYLVAGGAQRDRESALFAARLERAVDSRGSRPTPVAASLASKGPAAEPFRLQGAAIDATRDLDCLTSAVYFEARGEGMSGKTAVAQVVLNRVRHPAFPKSVCGVVFQGAARNTGCQFSFACNGQMRQRRDPTLWERSRKVAAAAMAGAVDATVGNATHFHATRVNPSWSNSLVRVAAVGNHVFYRFGGRAGRPGAFRFEPAPSRAEEFRPITASIVPTALPTFDQAGQAVKDLFGRHAETPQGVEAAAAAPVPAPKPAEVAAPVVPAPAPVVAEVVPTAPVVAATAPASAPTT